MYIQGGYVFFNGGSLSRLNAQISSRALTAVEGRGMLAFQEMRSIRKAAAALRAKSKKGAALVPNYSARELSRLTNLPLRAASATLKKILSSDFNSKESGKLIPVPRRLIRFLAKCEKRSTLLVLLSYIERGLSLDKGKIKCAGTLKASLIATKTGLTIRSVRSARSELLNLGILTPDTTKYQRKLNRDGAYFTINLLWNESKNRCQVINRKGSVETSNDLEAEKVPVDNSRPLAAQISLPPPKNCTKFSLPYRNKISSNEFRNQKTQSKASNSSGVFSKREGEGRVLLPPTIKNVQRIDLEQFSRCKALYTQACEAKLIKNSEASYLNFVAAAVRAKSAKYGDPAKIFMGILKKNLWMNITQDQEERARTAIRRYDEK